MPYSEVLIFHLLRLRKTVKTPQPGSWTPANFSVIFYFSWLYLKPLHCDYILCADTVLNFIRSHPLMDTAVSHENGKPVFYKRDLLFTHLVVDKLKIDLFGTGLEYIVYYAGTSE
jgi:hypothetical protein